MKYPRFLYECGIKNPQGDKRSEMQLQFLECRTCGRTMIFHNSRGKRDVDGMPICKWCGGIDMKRWKQKTRLGSEK